MKRSESTPNNFPRPSSSASSVGRPLSSASSIRPSSRASLRPPSTTPNHTPSAPYNLRPSSSASVGRPVSRISQRPYSRLSQRPPTRQSPRLASLSQALVTQTTGLSPETEEASFRIAVDYVSKNLDPGLKAAPSTDLKAIDGHIRGFSRKARINNQDSWATALETTYTHLKNQVEGNKDFDQEIPLSRLPDHLQFLILLSLPPTQHTINHANNLLESSRNPLDPPPTLSWKDILAEEPFEGQHWEGVYGLPAGSTVEGWEIRSPESTPPLSPIPSDDLRDLNRSLSSLNSPLSDETDTSPLLLPQQIEIVLDLTDLYAHRRDVARLQSRQYWRSEWQTDASPTDPFNLGDASTLGPSLSRVLGEDQILNLDDFIKEKYIHEYDAVREILMALQGRKNLLLKWSYYEQSAFAFELIPDAPRLIHLTLTAQASILASFAQTATILEHLRKFTACILDQSSRAPDVSNNSSHLARYNRRITRTIEACSDAVSSQLWRFDRWCAAKEEEICLARAGVSPSLIVSLLSLEKAIKDAFSQTFSILLDVLRMVMRRASRSQDSDAEVWMLAELPSRMPPSAVTTLLLDSLLESAQEHLSMGDHVTSDALMNVFVETATPIWSLVGQWLKNGMPIQDPVDRHGLYNHSALDDEFFIEDNELSVLDPDFWTEGYALRDGSAEGETGLKALPTFLTHIAPYILSAGKAIGLLRALEMPITPGEDDSRLWMSQWPPFNAIVETHSQHGSLTLTIDDLTRLVYDELLPRCRMAQARLAHVIIEDGDLWPHLTALEGLYLMRRIDVISLVSDALFNKMDSHQTWTDFHFLNSAFRDITDMSKKKWIDPSLVRLSYRGGRDKSGDRTVKSIDGLLLEYAAPFPLTYVFNPHGFQVYNAIFVFLLQIRRAKTTLERILVRGAVVTQSRGASELKPFHAMRSKLSWFINTFLDFIVTHVLHSQLLSFHALLRQAKSLDDIIQLHDEHLDKLEVRCFLQPQTSALHRAFLSILDMSLHFTDCFIAFAGDATYDVSRQSIASIQPHRSRRQKRQRKNTIGFFQSLSQPPDSSSDSDTDEEDPLGENSHEPSFSMAASSISFVEEDPFTQINKMSSELDGLIRFIRRSAESLAGDASEAASIFGIFAFALEDWDR